MAESSAPPAAMTEESVDRLASLLGRYQRLKFALLEQLNGFTPAAGLECRQSLRQTLREWCSVAEDPSLPAAAHYLLDYNPETTKPNATEERDVAVLALLYEIAWDEDLEVFLTILQFGPGDDARLVRMADRHGNDIHEFFASENLELLQEVPAHLTGQGRMQTGIALLPTSRTLGVRFIPGQTDDDKLHLLENFMCYSADRVLVKADVHDAFSVLEGHYDRLKVLSHGTHSPFQWPRRPLEKSMINAITVNFLPFFVSHAASYPYEPSLNFFERILNERCHSPAPLSENNDVMVGLDSLLDSVQLVNLLPVLRYVDAFINRQRWPGAPDYIREWLKSSLANIHCKPRIWCRTEDAAIFVDILMAFLDVDSYTIMRDLVLNQINNPAFCFALMVHILRAPADSMLDKCRPRLWAWFEECFLDCMIISDLAKRTSSYGVLPRFPKASSWDDRQSFFQPMNPKVISLVGEIVDRLSQDPREWWNSAFKGFLEWIDLQLRMTGDSEGFLAFWLPLLRDISLRDRCCFLQPSTQSSRPEVRNLFRDVFYSYFYVCVGKEPRRRDFARPEFSIREGGDGCASCRLLGSFLVDHSRVRAIFPVTRPGVGVAAQTSTSGVALQQSTLDHVLPLLASPERKCVFHIKDSTMGTVLCVEKRDGEKQWEDWNMRRREAAQELASFDHERMKLILGENDYKAFFAMEIGIKIASKESRQMIGDLLQHRVHQVRQRADLA